MSEPFEQLESPLPDFAGLVREVECCGWEISPIPAFEGELFFRTFQGGQQAHWGAMKSTGGRRLLVIALEQVKLPGEDELFPRYLNLSLEERMALAFARLAGPCDWLLYLTRGRVDLYRLPEETGELRAVTQAEFQANLLPELAALARGRHEALRNGPRHLPGADSLRGWIRHWTLQLGSALEDAPDRVEQLIWKWILMLQLARRSQPPETAGGWGLSCLHEQDWWIVAYDAQRTTDELCEALTAFDQTFRSSLFEETGVEQMARLRRLEETAIIDRFRAELLMQSQDRFEPETVAWLFTDLAREQEGWRLEVSGVEPIRRRLAHESWNVYRPLICDVDRHGLTYALRDFDRLAQYLNDQLLFMRERRAGGPEQAVGQPDLFKPNPRGVGPTGQLDDPLNFIFAEALRLEAVRDQDRFGVGITFLLKALALLPPLGWPFFGIDTLDQIFTGAP